jgi:predicted dehydrogenase
VAALGHLAAVVDPSESGRANAAAIAPDVPVRTLEEVLADPSIAGVMIATPAETHFDVAMQALEAGKDVFVEKPITLDVADAQRLVDRADALGRMLMVGHLLEYHPAILTLAKLIEDGVLGSIRYIASNRLNLGKVRTEENALWSFAPHDIAVILRLVGQSPFQVVATGGSYVTPNIADTTVTQLLFDNGVRSHVYVSWLHPFKEQKLVVVGSEKMASFCDVSKELMLYDQRVEWREGQPVPVKADGESVAYPDDEPLKAECRHFIESIEQRRTPRTCGREGLRVLQILHAAQRSLATNGTPVAIEVATAPRATAGPAQTIVETMPAATAAANGSGTSGNGHARIRS